MHNLFKNDTDRFKAGHVLMLAGICIASYFGIKTINEIKTFGTIHNSLADIRTIDVSGTGDAFAIPDIAIIHATIEQKAKNVHDAQVPVTEKASELVTFLKKSGIAEKDIKTLNYSANPEYEYPAPCYSGPCPASSRATLIGYTVSQTLSIKIRDIDSVPAITEGIGALKVSSIQGPDFSIDDEDMVKAEARKNAIDDAEAKAKILAKDLGVKLVRVVRFNEGNSSYPMPMYAKMQDAYGVGGGSTAESMPEGESKYTANVTITYEIR